MPSADAPSRAPDALESPFLGAPFAYVPAVIAGMVVGVIALCIVGALRTDSGPDPVRRHLLPWARPMSQSDERDQVLYHAGIVLTALGGFAGAFAYNRWARVRPMPNAPQKSKPVTPAKRAALPKAPAPATNPSPRVRSGWLRVLPHAVVGIGVVLLLYIPDYRSLAGTFLNEHFHHWHFFAIAPTHAYLKGLVPALESYSQYGVGLPVIIGNLCRLFGDFSHGTVVWLGMTYGVIYFIALYALLWLWLRDWVWSAAGLVYAVLLQQFCGLEASQVLWQFPSSTILRSPLDVWVFLLMTGHVVRQRWAYLGASAIVAGAAMFWETDTGLYLVGSLLAYCAYCWLDGVSRRGWSWADLGRYLAAAAIAPAAFVLLAWFSFGGAIFTALFWERLLEPMRLFRAGFGMLPMPAPQWGNLYLFLTPGLYVFAAVLALVAALRLSPQSWRGGYLLGALGIYGLGVYHQYVGRSHPWNWFHVCIPVVVLATMLTRVALQALETRLHARAQRQPAARIAVRATQLAPVVLLGTALVLLLAAPSVHSYPGILSGRWFIPGVDWDFPGVEFRTLGSEKAHDWMGAVAARIQQTVPANEPVAILSEFDAMLYIMSDRRPFSRFVPIYPATVLDYQVQEVFEALRAPNLRYVFLDRGKDTQKWSQDLPRALPPRVAADYELVQRVDRFEVWRRRPPAPPS